MSKAQLLYYLRPSKTIGLPFKRFITEPHEYEQDA